MVFDTSKRKLLSALSLASLLLGTAAASLPVLAQGTGLTLFSGVKREFLLPHSFDFDTGQGGRDRYRLRIPSRKMRYSASSIVITYPAYYKGTICTDECADKIEVFVDKADDPIAVESIVPPELVVIGKPDNDNGREDDDDIYRMEILLQETIPEESHVEIVLSDVKNPRIGQTYYFNARVQPPRDIVERYIGTWIVSID